MVETEMPREASLRPSSASSSGEEGPDVGETVRQKHDAVDVGVGHELLHLPAAFLYAVVERGRSVGRQPVDRAIQVFLRAAQGRGRAQHVDVVIEGDDGDGVVGGKPLQRHARALLGRGDARALHGAGAVDDDGRVDACAPLALRSGEALQAQAQIDAAGVRGRQHRAAELRVDLDLRRVGRDRRSGETGNGKAERGCAAADHRHGGNAPRDEKNRAAKLAGSRGGSGLAR